MLMSCLGIMQNLSILVLNFYKNDLMDSILNERIYNATSVAEVSDAARLLYRVDEMNAEQRRNLNYSMWRAQYNAVTEVYMHTDKGGLFLYTAFSSFQRWHTILPLFRM